MKFAALIFDLDETIVEEASIRRAFLEACEVVGDGCGVDPEALYRVAHETWGALWTENPARAYCSEMGISATEAMWGAFSGQDKHLALLHDWVPGYRVNAWRTLLRTCGVDDTALAGELAETYPAFRQKYHVAYDDAIPVLERLKPSYKLGMLTNGAPDVQRSKIAGSGLDGLFDVVVVSGEVGVGKPERLVFETVLSRLGVSCTEALMVGDNLRRDIEGGQRAGLRTAWMNRHGRTLEGGVVPDFAVVDMLGLEGILLDSEKR